MATTPPFGGGNSDYIAQGLDNLGPVFWTAYNRFLKTYQQLAPWSFLPYVLAGMTAAPIYAVYLVIAGVVAIGLPILYPLIQYFLKLMLQVRTAWPQEQADLAAAALSEYFGFEVNAAHVKPGQGASGARNAAAEVGAAFLQTLSASLPVGAADDLAWAEKNAQTFAGFGINFGVQNAMMGMLTTALSNKYLEDFKSLGEDTAHNIGLSRLMRVAMQPLVQNAIAKPYDKLLRQKYRQDDIAEGDLVKAYYAGTYTLDQVKNELAKKGYPDQQIEVLVMLLTPRLADQELERLSRFGYMSQDEALAELQKQGIPQDTALKRIQAIQLAKQEAAEHQYAAELGNLITQGFLDVDSGSALLDTTHMTVQEKQWTINKWQLYQLNHHKRLSLAEVQTLIGDGILTLDDLQQWAAGEGYSEFDETLLEYLTMRKVDQAAAKAAAAAAKAAASAQKKTPTKKPAA